MEVRLELGDGAPELRLLAAVVVFWLLIELSESQLLLDL